MSSATSQGPRSAERPFQLSVGGLMLLTTVIAVFVWLCRIGEIALGAVHFAIFSCIVWATIARQRLTPPRRPDAEIALSLAFGVVLPVACFLLDPFVFRRQGMLAAYWMAGYLGALLQVLMLPYWMFVIRKRRRRVLRSTTLSLATCFLGGALVAGGVFALMIALVLTPCAFIGLVVAIGALGFVPYGTAEVYLRHGVAALSLGGRRPARNHALIWALCGSSMILGPWILNNLVDWESPVTRSFFDLILDP